MGDWRMGQNEIDVRNEARAAFNDGPAGDARGPSMRGSLWLRREYEAGRLVWSPWLGEMLGVPDPQSVTSTVEQRP